MTIDPIRLGAAVRQLRQARKMTQQQVARQVGLSENYLSLLENGKRGISHPTLNKLAEALRINPAFIPFLAADPDGWGDGPSAALAKQIADLILTTVAVESDCAGPSG